MRFKNKTKVKCSECNRAIFYIPYDYEMNIPVTCIRCGNSQTGKRHIVTAAQSYARARKGKREDLGNDVFRSGMEANFARILSYLSIEYLFEKRTFFFHNAKRKPFQYTPDFEIKVGNDEFPSGWYETKGWFDSKSREKMRKFKREYPQEAEKTILVIGNKKDIQHCEKLGYKYILFNDISKKYSPNICTWE